MSREGGDGGGGGCIQQSLHPTHHMHLPSGGTIFTIPAAEPSGVMVFMYANGSANSRGVGRNTGHCGTATLFVLRVSFTLALIARCISASLKSPELASSLEGGRRGRFARPGGSTPTIAHAGVHAGKQAETKSRGFGRRKQEKRKEFDVARHDETSRRDGRARLS